MVASLSNIPPSQIERVTSESLARVELTAVASKLIRECSKGMRQRLALAQTLIGEPALLLLDEPSNGLDPEGQAEICQLIKQLHADGKTVILCSHQLQEVTQVCTRLAIINQGKVHYQSTMAEALVERPHTVIRVNQGVNGMAEVLQSLDPTIEADGHEVILHDETIMKRRQV
jgi:ABC-2 type transport system ATP-binding protein